MPTFESPKLSALNPIFILLFKGILDGSPIIEVHSLCHIITHFFQSYPHFTRIILHGMSQNYVRQAIL
ncbi:hypothetical protein HRI_002877200 [Hibiscus trionum]|uniref:Uncharacterized protein n=1 Tax=Hibiscus trionum TaxID=183268 RepID=A0A9W7I9U7_HIBTR|nr:hypothetical protein HRI_002877200 [Hibiscus trionum]